jgi:hypothetical protein
MAAASRLDLRTKAIRELVAAGGWVSLALLAAAAQWVAFRYFGPRADRQP